MLPPTSPVQPGLLRGGCLSWLSSCSTPRNGVAASSTMFGRSRPTARGMRSALANLDHHPAGQADRALAVRGLTAGRPEEVDANAWPARESGDVDDTDRGCATDGHIGTRKRQSAGTAVHPQRLAVRHRAFGEYPYAAADLEPFDRRGHRFQIAATALDGYL